MVKVWIAHEEGRKLLGEVPDDVEIGVCPDADTLPSDPAGVEFWVPPFGPGAPVEPWAPAAPAGPAAPWSPGVPLSEPLTAWLTSDAPSDPFLTLDPVTVEFFRSWPVMVPFLIFAPVIRVAAVADPPSATNSAREASTVDARGRLMCLRMFMAFTSPWNGVIDGGCGAALIRGWWGPR